MTKRQEIIDNFRLNPKNLVGDAAELVQDMLDGRKNPTLRLNVDATHSGRLTNNRVYPGSKMKKSVDSFMLPKPRPVLKAHNWDEDPIGRVAGARFIKIKDGDAFSNDYASPSPGLGSGYIQLDLNIMDADSIFKFLDERFTEFSTAQGFDELSCSICANDFLNDHCGHIPGQVYEIETDSKKAPSRFKCYAITGKLKYREVSVVNIAGDDFTGVNSFELVGSDSLDRSADIVISCVEDDHDIGSIVLANAEGETVDLVLSHKHSSITSSDRKKLTGKVIVAASPLFNKNFNEEEGEDMPEDNKPAETTEDQTADDTQNTDTPVTSESDSEPNQKETEDKSTEGVAAPETETPVTNGQANDDLDNTVLAASLKAMTAQIKSVEAERDSKTSEVERLKGQLTEKDSELELVKKNATDSLTELKNSLAKQLLDTKLFLCKTDVAEVKTSDTYDAKLVEYSERTSDSLKDAISDLNIEIIEFKSTKGITASQRAANTEVDNPVSNNPVSEDASTETPLNRDQFIESVLE
jgi:hypothetical protein